MFDFLGTQTDFENVVVMTSGGRSSHYMAYRMQRDPYWQKKNLVFLFSNTGKEAEATLRFVQDCDERWGLKVVWVEAAVKSEYGAGTGFKIVNFFSASRNGEPFEAVIQKYGISNNNFPHCTRELKQRPLQAYCKEMFGTNYVSAIGMRFDELRRVKQKDRTIYPLAAWMVILDEVRRFWNESDFDLQLKDYEGNCDLCWKKSLRKKLTILKENPSVADWWHQMEEKYGTKVFMNRQTHEHAVHFNRGDQSILELVTESQKPFVSYSDPYWKHDKTMDEESPCSCMRQDESAIADSTI